MKFKDLSGQRFGRLTAVRTDGVDKSGRHMWLCRCDCGKECTTKVSYLTAGQTRSCGCLHIDAIVKHNKSAKKVESTAKWNSVHKTTHSCSGTRLYKVWVGMKARCNNPKSKDYSHYGGRGITVCDAWDESFDAFKTWSEESGYDETAAYGECTIDRIDVNGNYEPGNCRWVSMAEQNRNKRKGGVVGS